MQSARTRRRDGAVHLAWECRCRSWRRRRPVMHRATRRAAAAGRERRRRRFRT